MRRFDIRAILNDSAKRRLLIARGTVAIQAREGVDITLAEALKSYDRLVADGTMSRVRKAAQES